MHLSREATATLYNVANMFFVASLVIGVISTIVIIRTGNDKEDYLRLDLAAANERSADAENRAAQANLKIAELTTPRTLDFAAKSAITAAIGAYIGTPFTLAVQQDPEAMSLLNDVRDVVTAAGWKQLPFPSPVVLTQPGQLGIGLIIGTGIQILVPTARQNEWSHAATTLRDAFNSHSVQAQASLDATISNDAIRIQVGRKP